jgi:hypothetical protein
MSESVRRPLGDTAGASECPAPHPAGKPFPRPGRPISMHEGIAVWCDCCSCEIEPYWAEVAAEMGVALGSDYEDEPPDR